MPNQVAIVVLLLTAMMAAAQDEATVSNDLERLRERIGVIQQQVRQSLTERDELTARLAASEREIGTITRRIRDTENEIAAVDERLKELQLEQVALEAGLAQQRQGLADQLRAAYAMGRQSRLKLWLNQDDPALLGRNLAYYRYFNRARVKAIDRVVAQLRRLVQVRAQIVDERAALAGLGEQLAREHELKAQGLAERRQALAALDRQLASRRQELGAMEAERSRLENLLEQLRDAFADIPEELEAREFATRRGTLAWPVAGRLLRGPGQAKEGALHASGALIAASDGAEVTAVAAGRVAFADWLRGFGLLTIIDHGDGYMSLYAFNESLFKDVGDWVTAGDLLGLVGRSGGREETALYFELRHQGKPVDPRPWFAAARP